MVALIKFEKDLFKTNNLSEKSFDDVYQEAIDEKSNIGYIVLVIFILIVVWGFLIIIPIKIFRFLKKIAFNPTNTSFNNYRDIYKEISDTVYDISYHGHAGFALSESARESSYNSGTGGSSSSSGGSSASGSSGGGFR